jgi:hypothetical protein
MARTTGYGASAGMLAFPPGRIVAVFVGAEPTGAPGTPVVVVVVVVPSVCPAAGVATSSTEPNSVAANPSPRLRRRERDNRSLLQFLPLGWNWLLLKRKTVSELRRSVSEP